MGFSVKVKWNVPPSTLVKRLVGKPADLVYYASQWHRLYNEFIPMGDSGNLSSVVEYLPEGTMGVIRHLMVYSHYQYVGSGFNFRRDKHPLASAYWDQAAKSAGKVAALVAEIQSYIGG